MAPRSSQDWFKPYLDEKFKAVDEIKAEIKVLVERVEMIEKDHDHFKTLAAGLVTLISAIGAVTLWAADVFGKIMHGLSAK